MKCPKCGSEKYFVEYADKGSAGFYSCYDCHKTEAMRTIVERQQFTIDTQAARIEELGSELDAVMVSVDKWFDVPRTDNPATRASDAREIALKAIEELEARLVESHKDYRIQNDEICRLQERLKEAEEILDFIRKQGICTYGYISSNRSCQLEMSDDPNEWCMMCRARAYFERNGR